MRALLKGLIAPNWLLLQFPWIRQAARNFPRSKSRRGGLTGRDTQLDDFFIASYFGLILLAVVVVALVLDPDIARNRWTAAVVVSLPTGHLCGWWLGEVLTSGKVADAVGRGGDPWDALVVHTLIGWTLVLLLSGVLALGVL